MSPEPIGAARAARLRHAFDAAFAEAPHSPAAFEDVLAIRCGPMACALRVSEIAGVFADTKLTRMLTPLPELLGIAALRGSIVPVYDLRVLLGYAADTRPRWLTIAAAATIAFAFDELEGHRRIPSAAIAGQSGTAPAVRHAREIAEVDGVARPIIAIGSLTEDIRSRLRAGTGEKE